MSERISALLDGEMANEDERAVLGELSGDADLAARWATYHLIGDVLRGTRPAGIDMRRFSARLAEEPSIVAPRPVSLPARSKRPRIALSLAAGVAAVGFVGWVAMPLFEPPAIAPVALKAEPAPVAAVRSNVIPAAHGVEDYLLAHQRFSPTFAIQGAVPYVRMVSEEGREQRR